MNNPALRQFWTFCNSAWAWPRSRSWKSRSRTILLHFRFKQAQPKTCHPPKVKDGVEIFSSSLLWLIFLSNYFQKLRAAISSKQLELFDLISKLTRPILGHYESDKEALQNLVLDSLQERRNILIIRFVKRYTKRKRAKDIFETTTKEYKMPLRYKEKYKVIKEVIVRMENSGILKIVKHMNKNKNILRKYNNSREWNNIVAFIYILYQWTIECKHLYGFISPSLLK